jgi:hypothetical protein
MHINTFEAIVAEMNRLQENLEVAREEQNSLVSRLAELTIKLFTTSDESSVYETEGTFRKLQDLEVVVQESEEQINYFTGMLTANPN